MNNEPIEKWQTAVKLDYNGFAVAGGDSVDAQRVFVDRD
jgi:hypothetical protein